MTILAGAGGDDSEDFAYMLFFKCMMRTSNGKGTHTQRFTTTKTTMAGYRNLTIEIDGKVHTETSRTNLGVHRLVRISPFNAQAKRHTSLHSLKCFQLSRKQNANLSYLTRFVSKHQNHPVQAGKM